MSECTVNWVISVKYEQSIFLFRFEEDLDDYSVIMVKALADRLAEVSILKMPYLYIYFETPFKLVLLATKTISLLCHFLVFDFHLCLFNF